MGIEEDTDFLSDFWGTWGQIYSVSGMISFGDQPLKHQGRETLKKKKKRLWNFLTMRNSLINNNSRKLVKIHGEKERDKGTFESDIRIKG